MKLRIRKGNIAPTDPRGWKKAVAVVAAALEVICATAFAHRAAGHSSRPLLFIVDLLHNQNLP